MSILEVISYTAMSDQSTIIKSPQSTTTSSVFAIGGQAIHQNSQGLLGNSTSVTLPSSLPGFQLGGSVYDSLVKEDTGTEVKSESKVDIYSVNDEKGVSGLAVVSIPFQDGAEQTSPITPTQNSSQILSYRPSATTGDAMLSAINYNENEILQDGAFDVSVAGTLPNLEDGILSNIGTRLSENPGTSFDLFDGEGNVNDSYSMDDLSPQPFHDPASSFVDGNLGSVMDPESLSADPNKVLDKNKKSRAKQPKNQALSPGRQSMTCPTCNKVFNNSSALAKHRLTHSDERKYICNLCHKAFKRQDHLNGHLMTHRDKKPYECNVENCSKSYCDARSLRRHLENHHNQTPDEISTAIAAVASNAAAVIAAAAASNSASIKASGILQTNNNQPGSDSTDGNGNTTPNFTTAPLSDSSTPLTSPVYNNPHQTFFQFEQRVPQQIPVVPTTQQLYVPCCILPVNIENDKLYTLNSPTTSDHDEEEQEQQPLSQQPAQVQTITIQPHPEAQQLATQQTVQNVEPQQQPASHHPWQEHVPVYKMNPLIGGGNTGNPNSPRNGDQSPTNYMQQVSPISPVTSVGIVVPTSPVQSAARTWHSTSPGSSSDKSLDDIAKPVVCSICERRFKNIPALNGHMRLHGGYFKKEGKEEKKTKKNAGGNKDMGPPAPMTKQSKSTNSASMTLPNITQPFQSHVDQVSSPPGTHSGGALINEEIQSPVAEHGTGSQGDVVSMMQHLQRYQQHHQIQEQQLQQQQQQEQQLQQQLQQQIQQLQVEQQQLNQLLEKQIQDQKQQLKQQQQEQQIQQEQQLQHHLQQQIQQLQLEQQHIQQQFDQIQLQKLKQQGIEQQPQYQLQNNTSGSVPQSPQVVQSPLQRQTSVESVDYHYQQSQAEITPHSSVTQSPDITHQDLTHISQQQQQDLSHISAQLHLQQLAQQQQQRDLSHQLDLNLTNQDLELNLPHHHSAQQIQSPPLSLSSVSIQSNLQDAIAQIPQFALPTPTSANELTSTPNQASFVSPVHLTAGHMKLVTNAESQDLAVAQLLSNMNSMSDNVSTAALSDNSYVPSNTISNISHHAGNLNLHNTLDQNILEQNNSLTQHSINSSNSLTPSSQSSGMIQGQTLDNSDLIKSDILDQLTNKMFSSRAAEPNPFSFPSGESNSSGSNVLPNKDLPSHNGIGSTNSSKSIQNQHKELRRRLSVGSECDLYAAKHSLTAPHNLHNLLSKGSTTNTYIKPSQPSSSSPSSHKTELNRPRMRSKSGDDYKFYRSASVDHSFMRPRSRTEDFMWKYKISGDDHWEKPLSKSDGAGLFRNPNMLTSPLKMKRKNRPSPLFIPPHLNNGGFQSRLRSPRVNFGSEGRGNTPPPYTPPPMLSPIRSGSGLFWSLHGFKPVTPKSAPITPRSLLASSRGSAGVLLIKQESLQQDVKLEEEERPPETDTHPHVNIGPQYQAEIPAYNSSRANLVNVKCKEDLVWNPNIMEDEEDVQYFQDFAACAAVKGNGVNVEYAMHLLHMAKGNIQEAMLALMEDSAKLPVNHTLLSYTYQETDIWSTEEIEQYTQGLIKYDKDFHSIAKEINGKSCKQCVQLYYLWKKVCPDEHKRLRVIRRKREQEELYNLRSRQQQEQASQAAAQSAQQAVLSSNQVEVVTEQDVYSDLDSESSLENYESMDKDDDMLSGSSFNASPASFSASPNPVFTCDYPECNANFTSKKALSGHARIHGGGLSSKTTVPTLPPPPEPTEFRGPGRPIKPQTSTPIKTQQTVSDTGESFPCKLCGRVFAKVKSRSAHMKSHRVVDGDKNKVKQKTIPTKVNISLNSAKVDISVNNIQGSPNG